MVKTDTVPIATAFTESRSQCSLTNGKPKRRILAAAARELPHVACTAFIEAPVGLLDSNGNRVLSVHRDV
jgi:hypothetical protein